MININNTRKTFALIGMLGVFATAAASSFAADTTWQKNHPRREQVNNRLDNQNKRIKEEVKEGDMSKAQARQLHRADRRIRKEERVMARNNGGRLTKHEQKTLNRQEDAVSNRIGK